MVFPTWTITIECFFRDGPLISMVFQWFSWILVQWSAMVLASKKPKIARKLWHILFCYHCAYYFRIREHKMLHFTIPHHVSKFFFRFKFVCFMFLVLWAHSFATIAELQWFSKVPSPLNGMVGGNHWDQWFSDGFVVRQPLETMVFDGCAPLHYG